MARGQGCDQTGAAASRGSSSAAPTLRQASPDEELTTYEGSPTCLADCGTDTFAVVAVEGERIVGNIIYETDIQMPRPGGGSYDGTWVNDVWVDEDARGRGIFRSMLAELCRQQPKPIFIETGGNPSVRAAVEAWNMSVEHGSGDGFVNCSDGRSYWGIYGAAGVIFRHVASGDGEERFFLVLRSDSTEDGGVWGCPGGALDLNEQPLAGALRETFEETGYAPADAEAALYEHVYEPGPEWSYRTFVVDADQHFEQSEANWETDDAGWFTRAEMAELDLHPGVAAALAAFDASR